MKKIASQTYYKTTQRDPLEIVTVIPLLIVIGPTDTAFCPEARVDDTVTVLLLTVSPLLPNTCGSCVMIVIMPMFLCLY